MPIKIMYLADYYQGPHAGTEGQLLQLLQYLDRTRYDPSITFLRTSAYIEQHRLPCPVAVLNITKLARISSILRVLCYALTLRRRGYRLVHCFFNDSAILAPLFRLFGLRVIVSRRDMGFWYTPRNLPLLRISVPFINHYIANCHAVRDQVRLTEHVPLSKITVIYNGYAPTFVDSGAARPPALTGIGRNAPVIGIVANLRPIKRIDSLIEAFGIVAKQFPKAVLVVVGDASSPEAALIRQQLERHASLLGVNRHLIFTGLVEAPTRYVQQFTVAVLCSASEGLSNSLIEYMMARRPIVCTRTGGNAELIEDGQNGFVIPVGDARALADRVIRLLSNEGLASRLGGAAYATVSAYTHTRMVSEQMDCYDSVRFA